MLICSTCQTPLDIPPWTGKPIRLRTPPECNRCKDQSRKYLPPSLETTSIVPQFSPIPTGKCPKWMTETSPAATTSTTISSSSTSTSTLTLSPRHSHLTVPQRQSSRGQTTTFTNSAAATPIPPITSLVKANTFKPKRISSYSSRLNLRGRKWMTSKRREESQTGLRRGRNEEQATTASQRQNHHHHHQPYMHELTTLFSRLKGSKQIDSSRGSSDTEIVLPSMVARSRASSVMMEGNADDNGGRMFFAPVPSDLGKRMTAVSKEQ